MKSLFRILKFAPQYKRYYIGLALGNISIAILAQVQPLMLKEIIDVIANGKLASINSGKYFSYVMIFFIAEIGVTIISGLTAHFGDRLSIRLDAFLTERFAEHLVNLPVGYYDENLVGETHRKLSNSITSVTGFMKAMSNDMLGWLIATFVSLGIVYYYSWQVGLLLTLLYPIYFILAVKSSPKWQQWQDEINQN